MNNTPNKESIMKHLIHLFIASVLVLGVQAEQLKLDVSMGEPFLKAGQKTVTTLKVGITGFDKKGEQKRPGMNIALVIDKSSSMNGSKIVQAREAACLAIDQLGSDDVLSIVTYDTSVRTLVPATKVRDKEDLKKRVRGIGASGNTALFGGVTRGADEVRKFFDEDRVNRVILLSDGQANVGPKSPKELGRLGEKLGGEGITITTFGIGHGYNEDVMTRLAQSSDGNSAFVENSSDLVRLMNSEFGAALAVVANGIRIRVDCERGVRPVRALGLDADIRGQQISLDLNQILARQEKFVIIEVEVPAGKPNGNMDVAKVSLSYRNLSTERDDQLTSRVGVKFTENEETVAAKASEDVVVKHAALAANEAQKKAVELRDAGKAKEAVAILKVEQEKLEAVQQRYKSNLTLERTVEVNEANKNFYARPSVSPDEWSRQRKDFRQYQYEQQNNQGYRGR